MTDISHPVTTITGHDFSAAPLAYNSPQIQQSNGAIEEGAQEDDGQISCICGFLDDDGWTVQCDSCNKWQHQLCYYPKFEDRALPDDLQHYCVECKPQQPHDKEAARVRQYVKREEINGYKRQAPKSHKKKVKEPGYTNGWPLDKSRHDRNSASPRDQPPPSKRPKTSHKTSDSVTNASVKGHSRKRTVSNVNHRRTQSLSPEVPIPQYSREFIKAYNEDDWTITETNLHNSISVTNALSEWLSAPDDKFREMHGGAEKGEILQRWDKRLDEIPGKAEISIQETVDDRPLRDEYEYTPKWKYVTVQEPIAGGGFIGEIKGHVGFRDEYQEDPSNRWDELRHPEPFVFFHPRLPITIDARNEGTELRYIRRSCKPNAMLRILVTDQTDYRFCFMATEQIDPGVEVAVSWDTIHSVPELFRRLENGSELSQKDLQGLTNWVSNTLANFGPCACDRADCLMNRFDRRNDSEYEGVAQSTAKVPKGKKRKPGQHISPINTHMNSRSGSEARKVDPDDEPTDSSGSAGRGSASRDITPNTHYSHAAPSEMSERERKKFEREEAIFRKQEEERNTKQGKKKRNSGGSSLSTPNATTSKQLGGSSNYVNAGTSKQSGLPSAKPGRRPKAAGNQKSPPRQIIKTVKRPKPDYVDSSVQCDMDQEEAEKRIVECRPRKPFLSNTQRLLNRCALNNARRRGPAALAEATRSLNIDDKMDVDSASGSGPRRTPEPIPKAEPTDDTEMKDLHSSPKAEANSPSRPNQSMRPPPPPWPSQAAHSEPRHKPMDMHIQMPPPTFNGPSPTDTADSTGSPDLPFTASPATLTAPPSLFSPAVTAAVTPRKKMSLSEYSKQRKVAKDKETPSESKGDREGSPASTASGPVVSLSAAETAKAPEGSAVEDGDISMEDASAETGSPEATKA